VSFQSVTPTTFSRPRTFCPVWQYPNAAATSRQARVSRAEPSALRYLAFLIGHVESDTARSPPELPREIDISLLDLADHGRELPQHLDCNVINLEHLFLSFTS